MRNRACAVWVLAVGMALCSRQPARAEPAAAPKGFGAREIIPVPTLGGMQFWGDELCFHQWRIQRNALTGHCRLVDGGNLRYAFGSFEQCEAALAQIKRERKLPPMRGRAVIVLHGLAGPRMEMVPLAGRLAANGHFEVFNVGYPSTRRPIDEHAKALGRVIARLDGIDEINFVGFSMGNIVIRRYLAGGESASGTGAEGQGTGDSGFGPSSAFQRAASEVLSHRPPSPAPHSRLLPDPRIKRFVMLGPPNYGAELAAQLRGNPAAKVLLGDSLDQLGEPKAWESLRLGTPPCEFGVIAGGRGGEHGFNPALPGDNDGIVTVASTRLAGASDFVRVPVIHSLMPSDAKVAEYAIRYLERGCFVAPENREPIR